MARAPLFHYLRRQLRLARLSLRSGEPAAELAERAASVRNLSRRELLVASALAGAGLALGAPGPASARRPGRPPVLVFGAGIAGLTAAWRLDRVGVPVRLFEPQERVGGRMFSHVNAFPGWHPIELGGELIDTGHKRMRKLARLLDLKLDDYQDDDPALEADGWFFAGRRRKDAEVIAAFVPVAKQIEAELARLSTDWPTFEEPGDAETLDSKSLAQWLAETEMDGWFRDLLDVAYVTEFGLETAEQSALNLLLMIDTDTKEGFEIFGGSDERFHVRGGNDQIPRRLEEKLSAPAERGARLEAVRRNADGSFRCTVRRGEASEDIATDHVILAMPFTLLRQIELPADLPAVNRRAIDELGYGTNAKLMVGFNQRLWRTQGDAKGQRSNGSLFADLPFQLTWENTRLLPGEIGVLVNYTGGRHGVAIGQGSSAEQSAAFVENFAKVFPGIAAEKNGEVRFHWPTHPWTLGSYACYKPGQYTAFGGEEGRPVGGLHFAGEHTSSEAQGYMEGGCESGERAAGEVLKALGMRDRWPL